MLYREIGRRALFRVTGLLSVECGCSENSMPVPPRDSPRVHGRSRSQLRFLRFSFAPVRYLLRKCGLSSPLCLKYLTNSITFAPLLAPFPIFIFSESFFGAPFLYVKKLGDLERCSSECSYSDAKCCCCLGAQSYSSVLPLPNRREFLLSPRRLKKLREVKTCVLAGGLSYSETECDPSARGSGSFAWSFKVKHCAYLR